VEDLIFTISIVGLHESGKTTLIEKLITRLKNKYRVGSVKHSQKNIEFDKKGSDSWRHVKAGTELTCVLSENQFILIQNIKHDISLKKLLYLMERAMPKLDIILMEGFKRENIPKIILTKSPDFLKEFKPDEILAVVNDGSFESGYPQFTRDDIDGILQIILDAFHEKESRHVSHERMKVKLKINGENVAFNRFVADVLGNAVLGLTAVLKGVDNVKTLLVKASYSHFDLVKRDSGPDIVLKLFVNDKELPLRDFVQHQFANVLKGIISSIKVDSPPREVELIINWSETQLTDAK